MSGQSVSFQTTDTQNANGPNYRWVKCTYLLKINSNLSLNLFYLKKIIKLAM